ncbi:MULTISPECIES: FecR domain-containing protein [unclassified Pseudomonas]|uniref:FecR domain-containing protein n=1 Tax=unclassified Pseudomonas TaxID=196821 RepID=UPI000C87C218|nr:MULTISPECIES: FecR family protein [unclassified Pseudomonas]PMU07348.1 peptide ABC transporter substrate-binding protein [Pseudomonas sp. FW305-20]PMU13847.1 peptide ABC transporter substrate-binding protein [Pseudomonas sp. FW305-122]PMU34505.1 peptide ABC transporter substrate-binding protein [Pseudomonas sp. FW305-47B]PMX56612.1 peptide ABC transporter substrate-binding protein [Pseudomonas sp. FW305-33]PMX60084.1 peptide ABC transporter substrate-binding protein [Pseudomonas sp. FW305-6
MPVDNLSLTRRGEPHQQVVKQAIHWLLSLRNNSANARLRQQCETWRAEHHEHELAWQRVQSLQAELSSNLRAVPGAQVAFNTLENSAQGLGRRQALKLLSGALLMGSAAWLGKDAMGWQQWTADFATATGERRGFQLPDGTRLELNTASAVDLDYNAQQRLIKLTRGEIIVTCGGIDEGSPFDRPLRVHSRQGVYEGVGARFILRQDDDCTRLSVTGGMVLIHSPLAAGGTPTQVQAGQSYLIDHHQAKLAPPLDMDAGAWVDGLIVTRNMRLGDFLDEVGRYRHGYLTYSADIADLRLSGVFRLEHTDRLLAILPQTLPVQLRYRTRWWVTLERQA